MKFEITEEPLTVYVCHCHACKKQSGGAFGMAMVAKADSVKMLQGEPKVFVKTAQSGRTAECDFCPDCGNRLFHRIAPDAPIVLVKTGVIDDAGDLKPAVHLWTDEVDDWITIPEDVIQYPQQPTDSFAEAIAAYQSRNK
jgi:hypothetical protein